ncbi:cation:proton antiporter [Micromonospora endolithica]|uniref:Cation/H(+) antiporter n=1 Tax=Micromonospora endolithica TaxID=230091 RepID=A0A3A9ZKA2_9ACTN|nr:cation:proton antiporter [Micromonospora endolithica]RKN47827.1 cation/H(+) antiporter [Micromonospora endolithica]TWJ21512.1 Kef-type K+ transport system membrane component KefB [Micromonospora endolithica]
MGEGVVIFLVDLAIIVAVARLLGQAAVRLRQPRVVGEILAGVLLGPTLLGDFSDRLFPESARTALGALATVGLVLFVFLVGYELDRRMLRASGRQAVVVALGALAVPVVLGTVLGWWLVRRHGAADASATAFFIGVAVAVTAFPVLARIVTEHGLHRVRAGNLSLAAAAIDDVLAWGLLYAAVAYAGAQGQQMWRLALAVPYLLAHLYLVRPLLRRLLRRAGAGTGALAAVLTGLLVSCAAAEWIGAHYIFGAFLFGAVMPREGMTELRERIAARLAPVNDTVLVPVFFAVAGLNVDLSRMRPEVLGDLALVVVVAVVAKLLGTYPTARLGGLGPREALTVSTLMNTRGLTEIVVLTVGLQVGLIGPLVFSVMVAMALLTTMMAGPALWALGVRRDGADPATARPDTAPAPPRRLALAYPAVTRPSRPAPPGRRPGSGSARRDAA